MRSTGYFDSRVTTVDAPLTGFESCLPVPVQAHLHSSPERAGTAQGMEGIADTAEASPMRVATCSIQNLDRALTVHWAQFWSPPSVVAFFEGY